MRIYYRLNFSQFRVELSQARTETVVLSQTYQTDHVPHTIKENHHPTRHTSMRFPIAAAILAHAIPTISLSPRTSTYNLGRTNKESGNLSKYVGNRALGANAEPLMRTRKRLRQQHSLKVKNTRHLRQSDIGSDSRQGNNGRLRNVSSKWRTNELECDPAATADIGVLLCGVGKYCMESVDSKLGGICVSSEGYEGLNQRSLQSQSDFYPPPTVCDPDHGDYGSYSCECGDFDVEQNVGAFTCRLYEYECKRENLCGSHDFTHTISPDGAAQADYCYGFEKPYDINMCYTVDTSRNCNISVQNVDCAKCEVIDGVTHPVYGFIGYNCYEFDCTNTLAGIAGNNCAGNYVLDALNGLTMPSSQPSTPPPSSQPSSVPSQIPSGHPSESPTITSSSMPTHNPSSSPSETPSTSPTNAPSSQPSLTPTRVPSLEPTTSPSLAPTKEKSSNPTLYPSLPPSNRPSREASLAPSQDESGSPSATISNSPSESTLEPSFAPSFEPWRKSKETEANESRGQAESGATQFAVLSSRTKSLSILVASTIVFAAQFC